MRRKDWKSKYKSMLFGNKASPQEHPTLATPTRPTCPTQSCQSLSCHLFQHCLSCPPWQLTACKGEDRETSSVQTLQSSLFPQAVRLSFKEAAQRCYITANNSIYIRIAPGQLDYRVNERGKGRGESSEK